MNPVPIAVTCGDPSGVGPEIIESWLDAHPEVASNVTVIGPERWIHAVEGKGCQVRAVESGTFIAVPGEPSIEGAHVALKAMNEAATGCREGRYRGVVTGPVSKGWLQKVGFSYPGQTEFFADAWGGDPTMAFVGDRLRVVLVTWHVPLMQVGDLLRDGCLLKRSLARAVELMQRLGVPNPRIAVCGLNPHAGEGGILGVEEQLFIEPVLDEMRRDCPGVSTPLPADTVFYRALQDEFDCIIALYHDQGLSPLKMLEFHSAVNVTLGLPYVRTSPDHGTAFGIAGRQTAQWGSFHKAFELARQLT